MGKSIDYRKKMDNNRRLHIKQVRKIVITSAVASTLVFQPFIPVIENGKLIGFTEESASAATLAEVGILEDVVVGANLSNVEGPGPYNLDLSLTGTGLANVELVNPDTVALFSAPDLAGNIATAGPADIRIELLPITLDDLPALETLVTNLTGTLNPAVSGIVGSVDELLGLVPEGVLNVQGLEELQDAVNALNNVDAALADVLVYEDQVNATINPDGTITVDFSAGLDEYLETTINAVVLGLLNDVINASQALEVTLLEPVPLVGPLVNGLIDGILTAATGTILPAVQTAADNITNEVTDLTGSLVAAQVIGLTQINLPTTINKVPAVSGEVPVSGAVVNTNTIDAELLGSLTSSASVVIPELDTTAPVITPIADLTTLEGQTITAIPVEVNEESTVDVTGLPAGLVYDEATGLISGAPTIGDWGATEETSVDVTVTATDEAGNSSTEPFTITVQRDTDGDGIPDVTDDDDDNDGVDDNDEIDQGTDPKVDEFAPVISPIDDTTALENEPIDAIPVEVDEESTITVDGLPAGLAYDSETDSIVGTPTVSDWGALEDVRDFETTVTATDEAGNTSTEPFIITIQRDTDGDGIPDVTDDDDDNDGVTDEDEIDQGTNPKVDEFAPVITPIEDSNAIENAPIEGILVEVDESSAITVDGLPDGLAYDPETESITGTPTVSDWEETEETRDFEAIVTATDEAGNVSTEEFVVTVQRDTDEDGIPDVTDDDDDNDGVTDEVEEEVGTDPKDETDVPDFEAPDAAIVDEVTSEDTEIGGTAEPGAEVTVTFPNGETVTDVADENGDFTILIPEVIDLTGGEQLEVVVEDEAGNVSEVTPIIVADTSAPIVLEIDDQTVVEGNAIEEIEVAVENPGAQQRLVQNRAVDLILPFAAPLEDVIVTGLPEGTTYDPSTNIISGTPIIDDWEATEESRDFEVTVLASDEAGNEATEVFTITVQRDTDRDEDPDVTDPDDDNDGITDEEEIENGTDPKNPDTLAPVITPVEDTTAIENESIEDIIVEVNEPSDVTVDGLPEGLEYDSETGLISGTPIVDNWGETEESRDFEVIVMATDEAGNESTEAFVLTIERDTDGDTVPDVTDPDDDNDGITDEEEIENGTDPKDDMDPDTIAPVITPIEDRDAVENEPIEDIVVEVDEPSEVTVGGLPEGLEYDPETGLISGIPVVNDWGTNETEREFIVTITAEDEAGNISTTEFSLVIQRDLDEDGIPDVTDSDDDNDGYTDEEEMQAGTNPMDESNYPGNSSGFSTQNQGKLPQTGESQNIFKFVSGSVIAAVSALMLALNKKKKTSKKG